jgi:hypothetical protein
MIVAVDIGLANECNLACPHCYRPALIRQCLLGWARMGVRRLGGEKAGELKC